MSLCLSYDVHAKTLRAATAAAVSPGVAISGTGRFFFLHNPPKEQFIHSLGGGKLWPLQGTFWSQMSHDIEVSEFHLMAETPVLSTHFKRSPTKKANKKPIGHSPEDWRETLWGCRKKLSKQISCQVFIKLVMYPGAWDFVHRYKILTAHVSVLKVLISNWIAN